jgi:hypothetical protein
MAAEETKFTYKGKQIKITETHPDAVISIDGREFRCHHHHGDNGLAMWMCDEAYYMTPDIKELARHFADYGYMYDDPNRVVVNDGGEVMPSATEEGKGKGPEDQGPQTEGNNGGGSHSGHGSGGGH